MIKNIYDDYPGMHIVYTGSSLLRLDADSGDLFEVGGKNKTFEQIKDIDNSYLAVDDEEIGRRNRIPLWMFGMMY